MKFDGFVRHLIANLEITLQAVGLVPVNFKENDGI